MVDGMWKISGFWVGLQSDASRSHVGILVRQTGRLHPRLRGLAKAFPRFRRQRHQEGMQKDHLRSPVLEVEK